MRAIHPRSLGATGADLALVSKRLARPRFRLQFARVATNRIAAAIATSLELKNNQS